MITPDLSVGRVYIRETSEGRYGKGDVGREILEGK